jgi:hypothetical protein
MAAVVIFHILLQQIPVQKQLEQEADHSPSSRVKVKNVWTYTSTHPVCFYGMVLS